MTKPMTKRQKDLITLLGNVLIELSEQCEHDENFHDIMIENNHLIPMSLEDLAFEWYAITNKERGN